MGRGVLMLLLSPVLLILLLNQFGSSTLAIWLTVPTSGTKCVSEEIQHYAIVFVIPSDHSQNPTIAVKVFALENTLAKAVLKFTKTPYMKSARYPQPKIPSPTSSAPSKGELKVSPINEKAKNILETAGDKKAVSAPQQTSEHVRNLRVADVSEATHESECERTSHTREYSAGGMPQDPFGMQGYMMPVVPPHRYILVILKLKFGTFLLTCSQAKHILDLEQVEKAIVSGPHSEALLNSHTQPSSTPSVAEATLNADNISSTSQGEPSSPVSVAPVVTTSTMDELEAAVNTVRPSDTSVGGDKAVVTEISTAITPTQNETNNDPAQDTLGSADGVPAEDKEDGKTDSVWERRNHVAAETKAVEPETLIFANKMEAKDAFKALLESANVGFDWTRDRVELKYLSSGLVGVHHIGFDILNDNYYSLLLIFLDSLSKAMSIFENDERFKAVERDRDRRDMFESFLEELLNKVDSATSSFIHL
ncbi:hypothetical protein VNO80_18715 [Phaseolus coccineus]|uniref:FF domain-containing protein n=1 Tax=Phaseolus coccineus TaxID=3886 RepID=A0AAN9QZN9_PHACN